MIDYFQKIGSALSGWIALVAALSAVAGSYLYTRFATRRQVEEASMHARSADAEIERRLSEVEKAVERRVIALEKAADRLDTGLKNTPTRGELNEVKIGMERLQGGMQTLGARLEGVTAMLAKIEKPLDLLVEHQLFRDRKS